MRDRARDFLPLLLLATLVGLSSCTDSTTDPPLEEPFSLDVVVRDPDGMPVEGLDVIVAAEVLGEGILQRPLEKRSRCVAAFTLASESVCDLRVYDAAGDEVAVLLDRATRPAGQHTVSYADDTQGSGHLGVLPLRFELIVTDSNTESELLRAVRWAVRLVWPDLQRSALGTTDAEGRWGSNDALLAPALFDLPLFDHTDESGQVVGTYSVSSTVIVMVRDPATGAFVSTNVELLDEANRVVFEWNPTRSQSAHTPISQPAQRGERVARDTPVPPATTSFDVIYPSPFN